MSDILSDTPNAVTVEPPPFAARPLPPIAPRGAELASAAAARSPITPLRHVAMAVPDLRSAVAFYEGIWGLYRVAGDGDVVYLGSPGVAEPYIIRLRQAEAKRLD